MLYDYLLLPLVTSEIILVNTKLRQAGDQLFYQYDDLPGVSVHGCWCSRFENLYNSKNTGAPIDKLDEICRNWFHTRNCFDFDDHKCEILTQDNSFYNLNITNLHRFDIKNEANNLSVFCDENNDPCLYKACIIDQFFVHQLRSEYPIAGGVTMADDCSTEDAKWNYVFDEIQTLNPVERRISVDRIEYNNRKTGRRFNSSIRCLDLDSFLEPIVRKNWFQ